MIQKIINHNLKWLQKVVEKLIGKRCKCDEKINNKSA